MYKYDYHTKTFTFEFTDKASYLAFRQHWKNAYRTLTSEIREAKKNRKPVDVALDTSYWQSRRETLRVKAREMMEARTASKAEAQRLYLAQRATPTMPKIESTRAAV